MFGRYKNANTSFNEKKLPTTRWQQFIFFLTNEKLSLLKIGCALLIFFIPYILVYAFQAASIINIQQDYSAGNITASQMNYYTFIYNLIFNSVKLVCLIVFSFGISGILRIIRNLVWNEGVFFFDDFKKGIKQNIKQAILIFIFIWIFLMLVYVFKDLTILTNSVIFKVGLVLGATLFIFLVFPLCLCWICQVTFYEGKTSMFISNSFVLLFSKYLTVLLFSLFFNGIIVATIFIPTFFSIIAICCSLLIISPLFLIATHLFFLNIFDKTINKDCKTYYKKGIY